MGQDKNLTLLILLFCRVRASKFEESYAYNAECSSICDAICDRTGVAPGFVLWGSGMGTLEGIRTKLLRC